MQAITVKDRALLLDHEDPDDILNVESLKKLKPLICILLDTFGSESLKLAKKKFKVVRLFPNQAAFRTVGLASDILISIQKISTLYLTKELIVTQKISESDAIRQRIISFKLETRQFLVKKIEPDGFTHFDIEEAEVMIVRYITLGELNNFDAALKVLAKLYPGQFPLKEPHKQEKLKVSVDFRGKDLKNTRFLFNHIANFVKLEKKRVSALRIINALAADKLQTTYERLLDMNEIWNFIFDLEAASSKVFKTLFHPDLKYLELIGGEEVTSSYIRQIKDICPKLKSLRLVDLPNLDSIGEANIFKNTTFDFPHLQFFYIADCKNLHTLYLGAPRLKKLELKGATNLFFKVFGISNFEVRAQVNAQIKVPSGLKVIRRSLEDTDVEKIKEANPESLDLSQCKEITGDGLKHLLTMDRLRHVDLSDNPSLPISHFLAQIQAPLSWISLSLSNCPTVSDSDLSFMPQALPALKVLRLDSMFFTDKGMSYIAKLQLEKLSLNKCRKLTGKGLRILEEISTLKILRCRGCPLITKTAVLALKIPGITIIHE